MGYTSKCCAKTHLPITVPNKSMEFNSVVALTPDGRVIRGSYDGYGGIDEHDLREDENGKWIWDNVKMVLAQYYNGETYDELPRSGDEMAQGYFMADAFLTYCKMNGPFKNRGAYIRAFKKYANW